jgi:hypothetical protein
MLGLRRIAYIAWTKPVYLFGRSAIIRGLYSLARATGQKISSPPPLQLGDKYRGPAKTLQPRPSGHVTSSKTVAQHATTLADISYSDGLGLDGEAVRALQDFARGVPLYYANRTEQGDIQDLFYATYRDFKTSPDLYRQAALGSVDHASGHPMVQAIAGDKLLVDIAARYLGYSPGRVSPWLFWSFANQLPPEERRARAQTIDFHYDVDGLNFVYFNFYLSDVTRQTGAHALIEGTHWRKRLRDLVGSANISDARAAAAYSGHPVKVFEGPAGTGFVEDTSCFHKAMPPVDGERLMLQLRYQ